MTLESYLPRLIGYAKFLSKDNYEDLVQDTVVRYLKNRHKYEVSEELLNTICRNLWIDGFKKHKEQLSEKFNELCDTILITLPEIEEQIFCKQIQKDFYNWPDRSNLLIPLETAKPERIQELSIVKKVSRKHKHDSIFDTWVRQRKVQKTIAGIEKARKRRETILLNEGRDVHYT